MSTIPEDNPCAGPDFPFPLQRHTRTEAVTAQLTEMGRLPRRGVLRRAADMGANRLALETLIAVLRAYLRAGDGEAADTVLEHLTVRLRGPIFAKAASWTTIAPADREDAAGEAGLRLLGYVRNLSPTEEFWECNFTHCFTQRMSTILKAIGQAGTPTVSLSGTDDEGGERDGLANLPDAGAEARFTEMEARESRRRPGTRRPADPPVPVPGPRGLFGRRDRRAVEA